MMFRDCVEKIIESTIHSLFIYFGGRKKKQKKIKLASQKSMSNLQ